MKQTVAPVMFIISLLFVSDISAKSDTIGVRQSALLGTSYIYKGQLLLSSRDFERVFDRSYEAELHLRKAKTIRLPGVVLAYAGLALFLGDVVQSAIMPRNHDSYTWPIAAAGAACLAGAIPFYFAYEIRLRRAVSIYNDERRLGEFSFAGWINKKEFHASLLMGFR